MIVFAVSVITAIPSIATMFSTIPWLFSSSERAREASPISTLPASRDSIPALDPVNSAVAETFGYFSMNASFMAFASFSMEVLPASVTVPLRSAPSVVSVFAVVSDAVVSVFASAFASLLSEPHPITPAATIVVAVSKAIIFTSLFFMIFSSFFHVVPHYSCYLIGSV